MKTELSNKDFFNKTSLFYDEMIDFENALERRIELLKNHVKGYKTVADLGCGSGLDSIALSKLGLSVTAFDQSPIMIKAAEQNAKNHNSEIRFIVSSIDEISNRISNKFDLIVSLGNTLANLHENMLDSFIAKLKNLLNTNGKVLIQILNYHKILSSNSLTISEVERSKYLIKRYYEKKNDQLFFKIRTIDKTSNEENIISTEIFPHSSELLINLFNKHEFKEVNLYGSLKKQIFEKSKSKDLIVIAEN